MKTESILNIHTDQRDPLNRSLSIVTSSGTMTVPVALPCTPAHLAAILRALAGTLDQAEGARGGAVCGRCGCPVPDGAQQCPQCGGG